MPDISLPYTIATGQQRSAAKVQANDEALRDGVNGLDDANVGTPFTPDVLGDGVVVAAGLNETGVVRRGKAIIATEESRTNTAYGTLTTPDQVASVVLPTDGLIQVAYQATWKQSVAGAALAAIHLGSNVASLGSGSSPTGAGIAQHRGRDLSANLLSEAGVYRLLTSSVIGLNGDYMAAGAGTDYTGDLTTGQIIGQSGPYLEEADMMRPRAGVATIFAAAGTYDVSIRFKSSSGSVTVKNRKLWVWTLGF